MVWANRTRDPRTIAGVARIVVVADMIFTATAVVQPLSGLWLIQLQGYSLWEPWLVVTYGLYGLTGACWLPVVWIQLRVARLAEKAASLGLPLPPRYDRLYRLWFGLGFPAFAAVIGIYAMMVFKPAL